VGMTGKDRGALADEAWIRLNACSLPGLVEG